MALSECPCGEPLYEYQLACPQCGAHNQNYVQFGWGRRIVVAVAGVAAYQLASMSWSSVTDRAPIAEIFLAVALIGAGLTFVAFRFYDAARLAAARGRKSS